MNLKNLSIRARLAVGFGAMVALVMAIAVLAWQTLSAEHSAYERYTGDVSVRLQLVDELMEAANARAIGARNIVLQTQQDERAAEHAAVLRAHAKVAEALARLQAMTTPAGVDSARERGLLDAVARTEAAYGPLAQAIVKLALDGRHDEAVSQMNTACRPMLARLIRDVDAYAEHSRAQAKAEQDEAARAFELSRKLFVLACAVAVLLAIGLAWWITPTITRPISHAVAVAQAVAGGDLTTAIEAHGRDEAAALLRALATMKDNLVRLVAEVRRNAEGVSSASAQIAQGTQDLSQRTEQQAAALQQTAASMDEIGSTVQHNADNASQADQLAQGASRVARQGGEVVAQVVDTMRGIEESSHRIADITRLVDGIAFQTNILALNAAVEAARAGEQGRGFAVVAGEVRALAQRSAEAAKEIKGLIDSSVQRVNQGAVLAGQAGTTMDEVVRSIQTVTQLLGELNSASAEQSRGVAQVGQAVNDMDRATQHNAALVEESAAAAASLRAQAQALVDAVAVFRLARGENALALASEAARPRGVAPAVKARAIPASGLASASSATGERAAAQAQDSGWTTF